MAGHDNYVIFQLDGIKGPIADNFRMVLNGLNQLRYIACSSTLSISPETLDFGLLQAYQATANQTIKENPSRSLQARTAIAPMAWEHF